MPDPELDRLLSALHDAPVDDLLWLAVADRLEELGEPLRAELLRLNRRLRGMQEDDERWAVEDRVRVLVNGGVRPCVPEIVNSIGMRFVLIPAGTFLMGSPEGEQFRDDDELRHEVMLTRPFWMGQVPVTQAQYELVTGRNPSYFARDNHWWHQGGWLQEGLDTALHPVESVSQNDAAAFCDRMTARAEEMACGHVYRLPTEAEWEFACRGGMSAWAFHVGDRLNETQANFDACGLGRTCATGGFAPNAFGLHDMHGNVWEWCTDLYGPYELAGSRTIDPIGAIDGQTAVARGGSYDSFYSRCRSASRGAHPPADHNSELGFRLVLDHPSLPWPPAHPA